VADEKRVTAHSSPEPGSGDEALQPLAASSSVNCRGGDFMK
jgi:hypothetical protein